MEGERWDPNAPLVCPYDPLHVISVKRFQRHLIKCRKNHPDLDFVTCPFNATHIFHRSELKKHIALCPDRKPLDPDIQQEKDEDTGENLRLKGDTSLPRSQYKQSIHHDEDWEPEIEENLARKLEAKERALKDFIPRLREPHFSYEERDIETMRRLPAPNPLDGYSSDDSEFSVTSKSSLYAEPMKGASHKDYVLPSSHNNKSDSSIPKRSMGRGLLGLLHTRNSERPAGRGSVHALLNQNIRKPTGLLEHPISIGRGSVRQAAIRPNN